MTFFSPVMIFALLLAIKAWDIKFYRSLIREDQFVEYLTFYAYLCASLVSFYLAMHFRKRKPNALVIFYFGLALVLLFFSGEEISWGQRLFRIKVPQFFMENSFQREINIHNLNQIREIDNFLAAKAAIVIGIYGGLGWLVMPVFGWIGFGRSLLDSHLIPRWYVSSYFLIVFLFFYYMLNWIGNGIFLNIRYKEQEIAEMLLAIGFLLFITSNAFRFVFFRATNVYYEKV